MSQAPDEARLAEILAELYDAEPEHGRRTLEQAIEDHPDLADELRSHAEMLDLVSEAFGDPEDAPQPTNDEIDGYRILDTLGRGGMATVYRAAQDEPVQREVAIKVLHQRLHGPQALARFEVERESLARVNHPNIARVLDAGFTKTSMPYVAMELVEGEPITDYCERMELPIEARLGLFTDVCEAVQHAHQKGVIHRDLKPTNVLVSDIHGKAHVKVIDFGLAKALDDSFASDGTLTVAGQILGTPAYMSPEQATGGDVDATTDVYGLGMLLYELLVGEVAWDRDSLTRENFAQFVRRLAEEEPPRPSARLSTLHGEGAPSTPSWERRLRGELDWITMKALAKERERRYATPRSLAEDVLRFLRHEPVDAGPPSTGYRVRKFVRRHRAGVSAAAVALFAILGGLAVSIHHQAEAREAQHQAVAARESAEGLFSFLLIDVHNSLFDVATVDLLERISTRALAYAEQHPASEGNPTYAGRGRALLVVGGMLIEAGRFEDAQRAFSRALAIFERIAAHKPNDVENRIRWALAKTSLGEVAQNLGRLADSKAYFKEARTALKRCLDSHPGEVALFAYRRADFFSALDVAGRDDPEQAIRYLRRLLEEGHEGETVRGQALSSLHLNLGQLLDEQGRHGEAKKSYVRAAKAARTALDTGPRPFGLRQNLGMALVNGSWDEHERDWKQLNEGIAVLTALSREFPAAFRSNSLYLERTPSPLERVYSEANWRLRARMPTRRFRWRGPCARKPQATCGIGTR